VKKKSAQVDPAAPAAPFNPALAGLAALKASLPASEPAPAPAAAPPPAKSRLPGKLVLSRERTGHGGKTMTRLSGLEVPSKTLEALARELKRALGCGAVVEGRDILVQGDHTERAAAWLRAEGAKTVIIGN
jgi:translation initiation factor 1